MASPRKVVIFDFDGTLADSVPIILDIYAGLATKNKWKTMTDADYKELRKGSLNKARKWAGIPLWKFPILAHRVKKLMKQEAGKVTLFPETVELINDLHDQNIELYVLSRNLSRTISQVLARYGLEDKLQILERRKRSLGSKTAALRRLMRRKKYDKKYTWMVGDEVRDILAAKRVGINSVAVAWGIQDVSVLEKSQPTQTAASVSELRRILQEHSIN